MTLTHIHWSRPTVDPIVNFAESVPDVSFETLASVHDAPVGTARPDAGVVIKYSTVVESIGCAASVCAVHVVVTVVVVAVSDAFESDMPALLEVAYTCFVYFQVDDPFAPLAFTRTHLV